MVKRLDPSMRADDPRQFEDKVEQLGERLIQGYFKSFSIGLFFGAIIGLGLTVFLFRITEVCFK